MLRRRAKQAVVLKAKAERAVAQARAAEQKVKALSGRVKKAKGGVKQVISAVKGSGHRRRMRLSVMPRHASTSLKIKGRGLGKAFRRGKEAFQDAYM